MAEAIRWEEFQDALEYGGTLYFVGNPREVSEQLLLAGAVLRDKAYSGGVQAIDYEVVMDRVQTSPGEGFGGWIQTAMPVLFEIRELVYDACAELPMGDDWKARAWLAVRRPLPERQTLREFSALAHIDKSTVHRGVAEFDALIAAALRRRGHVIRG